MRKIGVGPDVPTEAINAHLRLLVGDDLGRAFLRITHSSALARTLSGCHRFGAAGHFPRLVQHPHRRVRFRQVRAVDDEVDVGAALGDHQQAFRIP
jgi:hypothetical protein